MAAFEGGLRSSAIEASRILTMKGKSESSSYAERQVLSISLRNLSAWVLICPSRLGREVDEVIFALVIGAAIGGTLYGTHF